MRKALSFLQIFAVTVFFTSCNLFIDEEALESEDPVFDNVPEHTGEGYDAPVTVNSSGCEVTYQLKSDVRLITKEDQQRYIVSAQHDATNAFIEIHYDPKTPEDHLPVPGEVLLCNDVTDKFPMGCNHRVQHRVDEDGVIKFVATFCTLEDTYEKLDINGTVTQQYNDEFDVVSTGPVEIDANHDPIVEEEDPNAPAGARRVSFDVDGNNVSAHVELTEEKMEFKIPFSFTDQLNYGNIHGGITIDKEKNFYKVTNRLDFSSFSLSDMRFTAKLYQTVEEQSNIVISGGYTKSWRLFRIPAVRGKAIVIGPVVLVLFVNIDLDFSIDLSVSTTITKHKITEYTYTMDFKELTLKEEKKVVKNEDWRFGDGSITLTVSMDLKFSFGIGIYGKIISVRIIPTFTAKIEATQPLFTTDANGTRTFAIQDKLGVTFTLDFSVTLGVFLDLSLKNIIGSLKQVGSDAQKQLLKDLEADAKQSSEYYQAVVDSDNDMYDPSKKKYERADKNKEKPGDTELGLSHTFGPWHIIGPLRMTWFPVIKDKSFKVDKLWDKESQKMTFVGEFTCDGIGFFGLLGFHYAPALMISHGSSREAVLFPDDGGEYANMEKGKTYRFTIPAVDDDKTYTATPCYYCRPVSNYNPDAIDKGLPFCFTSPSMAITDIKPQYIVKDYNEDGFLFAPNGEGYMYSWDFHIKTYTAGKGMKNISSWYLKEINTGLEHNFKKSSSLDKEKDGTYEQNWVISLYSNDGSSVKSMRLSFYPMYMVNKTANSGPTYTIKIYTNWTYDIVNDGNEFAMNGIDFLNSSRREMPFSPTAQSSPNPSATAENCQDISYVKQPNGDLVVARLMSTEYVGH
ncbi:MAG: hypothetical protein IKR50_05755 [Prevotella sp.]|nr:hypothetical protein [Prevotella sp.]